MPKSGSLPRHCVLKSFNAQLAVEYPLHNLKHFSLYTVEPFGFKIEPRTLEF